VARTHGTTSCSARPVVAGHHGVVAPRPLTRLEMADLRRSLQALLDAIERDEMTASTGMVYRLEGAVTALDAVLARIPSLLDSLDY